VDRAAEMVEPILQAKPVVVLQSTTAAGAQGVFLPANAVEFAKRAVRLATIDLALLYAPVNSAFEVLELLAQPMAWRHRDGSRAVSIRLSRRRQGANTEGGCGGGAEQDVSHDQTPKPGRADVADRTPCLAVGSAG